MRGRIRVNPPVAPGYDGFIEFTVSVPYREYLADVEEYFSHNDEVEIIHARPPKGPPKTYFAYLRESSSQDEKTQSEIDQAEATWQARFL